MITALESPAVHAVDRADPLFRLQLQVARRADEVVRGNHGDRWSEILAWLQAEREVFSVGVAAHLSRRDAAGYGSVRTARDMAE